MCFVQDFVQCKVPIAILWIALALVVGHCELRWAGFPPAPFSIDVTQCFDGFESKRTKNIRVLRRKRTGLTPLVILNKIMKNDIANLVQRFLYIIELPKAYSAWRWNQSSSGETETKTAIRLRDSNQLRYPLWVIETGDLGWAQSGRFTV